MKKLLFILLLTVGLVSCGDNSFIQEPTDLKNISVECQYIVTLNGVVYEKPFGSATRINGFQNYIIDDDTKLFVEYKITTLESKHYINCIASIKDIKSGVVLKQREIREEIPVQSTVKRVKLFINFDEDKLRSEIVTS